MATTSAPLIPLAYGQVVGQFFAAVGDTVGDADLYPDGLPLNGTVTFTSGADYLKVTLTGGGPTSVVPASVVVPVVGGVLTWNGVPGVYLVATNSGLTNPTGFTWRATFNLLMPDGTKANLPAFSFAVPSGATVDLGTVVPVAGTSGTPLPQLAASISDFNAAVTTLSDTRYADGIYDIRNYGTVDVTGAANSNAAWNAAVAAWSAGGGGTILLPKGTILVTTQTALPSGNPSGTGMLRQPPLTIQGHGGHASGQKSKGSGGTRLNLTYQGAATPAAASDAKIQTFGSGLLVFKDIVLMDSTTTNSSTAFVYTTGTTVKADETVAVIGAGTSGGVLCQQDAFVLGGTLKFPTAPGYPATPNYGSLDAPFQGYGSSFEGVYFNFIRRAVYGRSYANQVIVNKCFLEKDCGSNLAGGAAIEFDGSLTDVHPGDPCAANVITSNYIEVLSYVYGVKLKRGSTNFVGFNGCEDAGAGFLAAVRLEGNLIGATPYGSAQNTILSNFATNSVSATEDSYSAAKNLIIDGAYSTANVVPGTLKILGNTLAVLSTLGTFYIKDSAGTTVTSWDTGAGSGPQMNMKGPLFLDGTTGLVGSTAINIGNNSTAATSALTFNTPTGQVGQIQFKRAGSNSWLFYDANSTSFFFRDSVNAKMHMTFTPGSGTGGSTDFNSAVKIIGNVGFYNTAPIAKQTLAVAAVDAATTQTLANDIRTKLIALGLTA